MVYCSVSSGHAANGTKTCHYSEATSSGDDGSSYCHLFDKTGTLTEGEMTVREIFVDSRTIEVTGAGYDPHGQFLIDGHPIDPQKDESLALAMKIAAQANNTSLKVLMQI